MKFKINRNAFTELLTTAAGAISPNDPLPIHQNLLITASKGSLEVVGSGMDLSIAATLALKPERTGEITINHKKLLPLVKGMPEGDISVELEGAKVSLKAGKSSYNVNGLAATEFDTVKAPEKPAKFKLEQKQLRALLGSTAFAVCREATRTNLVGILLESGKSGLSATAADGRRVAIKTEKCAAPEGIRVTVPTKSAIETLGVLGAEGDVEVAVGANVIVFKTKTATVTSKLLEAPFPNIAAILPTSFTIKATANREALIAAANRAAQMTTDKAFSVKLDFSLGRVNITAQSSEVGDGDEELDCKLDGEPVSVRVNPKYFIEALQVITEDEVTISLNDGKSPFKVSAKSGFMCTIAPINQ